MTKTSLIPRQLLIIAAVVVPVAFACNYIAHLRDVHTAPELMTAAAVAARIAPVAHVVPLIADAKEDGAPATGKN